MKPDGYWKLATQTIVGALAPNSVPLITSTASTQTIKAIRGGSSVSLSDSQGVVTISAASPENHPGNGLALFNNGKLMRIRAGVGIIVIGQNSEATMRPASRMSQETASR